MANEIVRHDVTALVDGWLEAERQGERFPVPFDAAWQIAGYSTKANGKRGLKALKEGRDFSSQMMKNGQRGRSSEIIMLSCDAMKHLCLMADTPEGEEVRNYFIECEKKWRLVQEVSPHLAQEIELMALKAEIAKQEAIKEKAITQGRQADLALIQFRHIVTTTMPEPLQQKILGYETVKEIEYRDRIIAGDDIVRDGSTATKTELCRRLGILTRNGKPDFRGLNHYLESIQLPDDAWMITASLQENRELNRSYLPYVEQRWFSGDRQRWLGE